MKLALGTAQFGFDYGIANSNGALSEPVISSILETAKRAGVDTLDTAIGYGDSETKLGRAGVSQFNVITKLPAIPPDRKNIEEWAFSEIDSSIERLGLSGLYGVLLHRPEDILGHSGPDLAKVMRELKRVGKVKKVGISIYTVEKLEQFISVMPVDIIQAPFNVLDRRFYDSGWMTRLSESGTEIHVRSALLQGLLAMSVQDLPEYFLKWKSLFEIWQQWIEENKVSAASACYQFVALHESVDRVVIGVDSIYQFEQLIEEAESWSLELSSFPNIACNDEGLINPTNWVG